MAAEASRTRPAMFFNQVSHLVESWCVGDLIEFITKILKQFENPNYEQLAGGNRTSIKSLPVIQTAMYGHEKQLKGGATPIDSILSAKDAMKDDFRFGYPM